MLPILPQIMTNIYQILFYHHVIVFQRNLASSCAKAIAKSRKTQYTYGTSANHLCKKYLQIIIFILYILFNLTQFNINLTRIEQIRLLVAAMIGPWAKQESICPTLSSYPVEITDFCYQHLRSKPWAPRRLRLSNRFTNMSPRNTLLVKSCNNLDHITTSKLSPLHRVIRIVMSNINLRID